MTTQQKTSRSDTIRQRRSTRKASKTSVSTQYPKNGYSQTRTRQTTQAARQSFHPASVFLPVEPRPVAPTTLRKNKGNSTSMPATGRGTRGKPANRITNKSRRKGYDFAFSLGRTAVRAPALSLPRLGSRWVSAGLTLLLCLMLYTLWTANTFRVAAADVSGNQRLDTADVSGALGMVGQPIFKAIPSEIEKNLRTAFPDLAGVRVHVGFPNHISVAVVERTPVLAWFQDDKTTWIDSNGVAFMPRGNVLGLIQVSSSGSLPEAQANPDGTNYDQPFISSAMVKAILALSPQMPDGAPMVYDPQYGLGWQDPRGWSVYFGQNTQDIDMKKNIYLAILETFSKQGIQPTLVSVAYLDAPFYK
jgi:hypothetical protein